MASRSALRSTDPKKVSGELFILTYGGLVSTLLKDYENVDDVNKQVSVILHKLQLFLLMIDRSKLTKMHPLKPNLTYDGDWNEKDWEKIK